MAKQTSAKSSDAPKSKRPDLNFSVEIGGGKEDKLHRCGALWKHQEGNGYSGYFDDTGSGQVVRLVLFPPKDGEFESAKAPSYKVFVEHQVEGEERSQLFYAGLAWDNRNKDGLNGFVLTNLLSGAKLRFVAMPPVSQES